MRAPFVALRATSSSARVAVSSAGPRPGRQQHAAARRPPALVPTPGPSSSRGRRRRTPPFPPLSTSSTGSGEHAFGPGTGRLPRDELAGPVEILRQASVDLRAAGSAAIQAFRRRNDVGTGAAAVNGDGSKAAAAKKGSVMGNSKFLPMVLL